MATFAQRMQWARQLDEGRWRDLHQLGIWELDQQRPVNPLPENNVRELILQCYDELTLQMIAMLSEALERPETPSGSPRAAQESRLATLAGSQVVKGFLMPLNADGTLAEGSVAEWIQSGDAETNRIPDAVMPSQPGSWPGGRCAERKWLETVDTRQVGALDLRNRARWNNDVDEMLGGFGEMSQGRAGTAAAPAGRQSLVRETQALYGRPYAYLLYTTWSPCVHCSLSMVSQLRNGAYRHLVVAFEACYLNANRNRPTADLIREKDAGRLEIFKVHRDWQDWEQRNLRIHAEGVPGNVVFQNPLSSLDPSVKVVRVTTTEVTNA